MNHAVRDVVLLRPGWVLPGAAIDLDFANSRFWGIQSNQITCSRASVGYVDVLPNLWQAIPANMPRFAYTKGLLCELAGTNLLLWCRDWSNAAYTKVSTTATLTATGIDGTDNSASTITATGALGTILQTVVQASTADTVSLFLRRRTGTGPIRVTANGVAFTDVAASLSTTAWYRASISATLVNPVVGLQIDTIGDQVDVDFGQLETGAIATSPILTTTVAVTRAADVCSAGTYTLFGAQYTILGRMRPLPPDTFPSNRIILQVDNGTTNERLSIRLSGTSTARGITIAAGVNTQITLATWMQGVLASLALAFAPGDQAMSFAGSAVGTSASAAPVTPSIIRLGCSSLGAEQPNSYIERVAIWPKQRLPNDVLQRLTA